MTHANDIAGLHGAARSRSTDMSDKVWRGWLVWSKERARFLYTMWAECQCDVCGDDEECIPCVAIPQSDYDALQARVAELKSEQHESDIVLINTRNMAAEKFAQDKARIATLEEENESLRAACHTFELASKDYSVDRVTELEAQLAAKTAECERLIQLRNSDLHVYEQLSAAYKSQEAYEDELEAERDTALRELATAIEQRDYWHRMCDEHDAAHEKRTADLATAREECERLRKRLKDTEEELREGNHGLSWKDATG